MLPFGIDAPIYTPGCEHRTGGLIATLVETFPPSAGVLPIFPSIPFSTNFPGYLEPTADHVRYIRTNWPISLHYSNDQFWGMTLPVTPAVSAGDTPPLWPFALPIGPTHPVFRIQPADATFTPGDTIELHTIFHEAIILDPRISLEVPYQWQKQDDLGAWIDLPNATNYILRIENAQLQHAGAYRLRATYNCEELYSRTANIKRLAPILSSSILPNNKLRLDIQLLTSPAARIQSSTNLQSWTDEHYISTTNTPAAWNTEITTDGQAKFYRVLETE